MSHSDLTVARWNELSDGSATRVARAIAGDHDVDLVEVRWHQYAGRRQRVALFDRAGLRFSLVPGGRVHLGYDGARFVPTPQQAASYAESADEYGLPALAAFVDAMTSPARVVSLPAMLVAVEAMDACAKILPSDDPRVQQLLLTANVRPGTTLSMSGGGGGGGKLSVELDSAGQVRRARLLEQISYDGAIREAATLGLRPASPDEWEYACGAGAATLFRWGDDSPSDGYPYDHRTGSHREPNLWALAIGQDSYQHEWTSEPTIVCGGDGGGATCGGMGFFLGWLTLATAYRDAGFGAWLNSDDGYVNELLLRPVIDLS
ncbi:hypothetical protein [Micromonospora sp. MW-13]|uniref:hypothetical protein n=1 Tax=Micromonospora sp. MW-13 TaxID=2094022 RepID=UPI000E43AB44|nr:hypothetical protein [Micromonospora sp. MW-13]